MVFFWRTRTMRAHHVPTNTTISSTGGQLYHLSWSAPLAYVKSSGSMCIVCAQRRCLHMHFRALACGDGECERFAAIRVRVCECVNLGALHTHTYVQPLSAPERVQSRQSERNRTMYKRTTCTHMHSNQFQSQFTTRPGPDNCCAQLRSGCGWNVGNIDGNAVITFSYVKKTIHCGMVFFVVVWGNEICLLCKLTVEFYEVVICDRT